ncbi:hypothetical protein EPN18_10145 [bacterium]|nr:MAG: hypothetical protein EPN18_10145 [bacterium]
MQINQTALSAIFKGYNTLFNEAFEGVKPMYDRIAMTAPSTAREETYAWLGQFPRMREWVGERVVKNIKAYGYTIKNKDWELTIEVDRNDIEDDKIGVYNPLFSELGRAAASHPDELICGLLPLGFNTQCYDGQYFFDMDHPVGNALVSNVADGAGASWYLLDSSRAIKPLIYQKRKDIQFIPHDKPSDDTVFMKKKFVYGVDCRDNAGFGLWQLMYASKTNLNAANYASYRAAMIGYSNDDDKPLGIVPNLMVVPPSLEAAGRALLMNDRDANGATNPWKGTAELIVCPWLR